MWESVPWVPWPGIKPAPSTSEAQVLTTGQPGKTLFLFCFIYSLCFLDSTSKWKHTVFVFNRLRYWGFKNAVSLSTNHCSPPCIFRPHTHRVTSQPKIDDLCLLEYECLGNLQITSCYYQFLQQFQKVSNYLVKLFLGQAVPSFRVWFN